jgi:hypothetical protein
LLALTKAAFHTHREQAWCPKDARPLPRIYENLRFDGIGSLRCLVGAAGGLSRGTNK